MEEFYLGKRKEKPYQGKDDMLYAMFDTSDFQGGSSMKKRKKDLSKNPLNFMAMSIDHNRKDEDSVLGSFDSEETGFGKDIGAFEKHTRGIGKKLLEKMGYKGGGLGKNSKGIVSPIEANLRPKNMGIGFNNSHKHSANLSEPIEEIRVLPDRGIQQKEKTWLKQGPSKKKEKEYVTTETLLVVEKLLDMRGPQVRVLTNLENLNAEKEEEEKSKSSSMPELQYNIRLIVDLNGLDMQKIEQDLRNEKERVVTLQKEKEKLKDDATCQEKQVHSMEDILSVLDRLTHESLLGTLTLESVAMSFWDLQSRYPGEYKLYSLSIIASSFALPLLIRVFQGWDPLQNPGDMSAYEILSSWKNVFDPTIWEQTMVSYIVPMLLEVMHGFQVNPADQKLDQFEWVKTWLSVIPTQHMLIIMEVFFNKWLQVLYQWLCSKPDYKEVINWYRGWKGLIPCEILSNERVRYWLNKGLNMMNQAAEGLQIVHPNLREKISYLKAGEEREFKGSYNMSLKEVIEVHALDNGLVFKPKVGRMEDGHQVYGFGTVSVIVDSKNQKVFAHIEDKWSLVTLEQLVKLEKSSVLKRR